MTLRSIQFSAAARSGFLPYRPTSSLRSSMWPFMALFNCDLGGPQGQVQFHVQGVEPEHVAMHAPARTGPGPGGQFVIGVAFHGTVGHAVLADHARRGRHVPNGPMHPVAHQRVRILHDEHQAQGLAGDAFDVEGRTDVLAVAGVLAGNVSVFQEGWTVYLQSPGFSENRVVRAVSVGPGGWSHNNQANEKGGRLHVPSRHL